MKREAKYTVADDPIKASAATLARWRAGQEILQVLQCDIRFGRHGFDSLETNVRKKHSVPRLENRIFRRQRRLHVKHIDTCTTEAILIQRFYQGRLVHDRPARSIYQDG